MVFITERHIGIYTLPPDGNPYKHTGYLAHPNQARKLFYFKFTVVFCTGGLVFTVIIQFHIIFQKNYFMSLVLL